MRLPHPRSPHRPSDDQLRWCADTRGDDFQCVLFTSDGEQLDEKRRAELLKTLRGGEIVELELEAVTYIQRATPNRNFVRFKPGILATFAKSFAGQPMLRDHASYSMLARGGTILSSKLEHNEDGSKQIRMRLKLSAPWMVEAALMGLLDRFSIGWSRTGPIECSVCEASIMKCDHWPGDTLADGRRVEFVFTAADGTEVSGVNVPAVVGTRVEGIQQLSALDRAALADILADEPQPPQGNEMDPQLLKELGLAPTATLPDVLKAIQERNDRLTIAESVNSDTKSRLAALELSATQRAAADKAKIIDGAIAQLIGAGKLKPASPTELALRRSGERDLEVFQAYVADLLASGAQLTPVGVALPAGTPEPAPATDGTAYLQANPESAKWLSKAGITKDQFEKHGSGAREMVAQWPR